MPKIAVSVVPLAATAKRACSRRAPVDPPQVGDERARDIGLRSRSTAVVGRTRPRSLAAAAVENSVGAPPGRRSRSSR
jgi:hypothetical protein